MAYKVYDIPYIPKHGKNGRFKNWTVGRESKIDRLRSTQILGA